MRKIKDVKDSDVRGVLFKKYIHWMPNVFHKPVLDLMDDYANQKTQPFLDAARLQAKAMESVVDQLSKVNEGLQALLRYQIQKEQGS